MSQHAGCVLEITSAPSLPSVGLAAPDILHKFHKRSHHIKFFFLLLSVDARPLFPLLCVLGTPTSENSYALVVINTRVRSAV